MMAKMSGIVKNVFFCDLVHSNVKMWYRLTLRL